MSLERYQSEITKDEMLLWVVNGTSSLSPPSSGREIEISDFGEFQKHLIHFSFVSEEFTIFQNTIGGNNKPA